MYGEISEVQLTEMIRRHKKWLNGELEGSRLDLTGYPVIKNVNITFCDLSRAILDGVIFENVNISGTSFRNASCQRIQFINVNATSADFEGADLRYAKLDFTPHSYLINLVNADLNGAEYDNNILKDLRQSRNDNEEKMLRLLEDISDSLKIISRYYKSCK